MTVCTGVRDKMTPPACVEDKGCGREAAGCALHVAEQRVVRKLPADAVSEWRAVSTQIYISYNYTSSIPKNTIPHARSTILLLLCPIKLGASACGVHQRARTTRTKFGHPCRRSLDEPPLIRRPLIHHIQHPARHHIPTARQPALVLCPLARHILIS